MRQIAAIFLDAYRELNSRRLFWIVLALSAVFVVAYASIGFDKNGMFILFGLKHFESDLLTEGSLMARLLYRGIFATFVVPIWLAWIATILALISTASIFPEFLASGSIDLMLSKPISRLKLFVSKYAASLLFVVLQVSVFCTGIFLAVGWRLGDWEPKIFLAIPLVTLLFSYLYSFCVLVGIWTRSTLAALLLTMLIWCGIYSLSATNALLLFFHAQLSVQLERMQESLPSTQNVHGADERPSTSQVEASEELARQRESIASLDKWLSRVNVIRWPLPKTSETVDLLSRELSREGDVDLMDLMKGRVMIGFDGKPIKQTRMRDEEIAEEKVMQQVSSKSPTFIIGTSLLFEGVMLALAAWIFCRRDF